MNDTTETATNGSVKQSNLNSILKVLGGVLVMVCVVRSAGATDLKVAVQATDGAGLNTLGGSTPPLLTHF